MKIGFAITAYDKFEEARILIEIIRKEFKNNYKISFCSNHPEGKVFAQENDIDTYIQGRDIPYFENDIHNPNKLRDRISIVLRSTDTVQKSCQNALTMDVDYIIHMHSDAWVLDEEKLIELVESMNQCNKKIAIRGGAGFDYPRISQVFAMDDHFFVFEKKFAIENKLFEFRPEYLFPDRFNVHEMLFLNIWIKAGLENIWRYQQTNRLLNYDGLPLKGNTVRPVSYDPYYKFLHIHRGSFPEGYGKKIQAKYLKECRFSKSEYIRQFIEMNISDNDRMLNELKMLEEKLNSRLKFWGFNQDILDNREISYKKELIDAVKVQDFFLNRVKAIVKKVIERREHYTDSEVLICYDKYFNNVVDRRVMDEFWNMRMSN